MRRALLLLLVVGLLLPAASSSAQKPPNIELGFKADKLYAFGDIDSVNLFNGNMMMNLPIGQVYPVSPTLSYQLRLTYNSNVWDYREYPSQTRQDLYFQEGEPNRRSNAGAGWRVTLGRLISPETPSRIGIGAWVYESPAGDEHAFECPGGATDCNVLFTKDQPALRLVVASTAAGQIRKVEFPNGEVHTFKNQYQQWRLQTIADRFGNSVSIGYLADSANRVTKWNISDTYGRAHTVDFTNETPMSRTIDQGQTISKITLQTYGGSTVDYDFEYESPAVTYGCSHRPRPAGEGGTLPAGQNSTPMTLLKKVTLPDDSAFDFTYHLTNSSCAQGALKTVKLPTGGITSYEYQQYRLPDQDVCFEIPPLDRPIGLRSKTTPDGQWDYIQSRGPGRKIVDPTPSDNFPCFLGPEIPGGRVVSLGAEDAIRWVRTSVLSPALAPAPNGTPVRTRADHYFNAWVAIPDFYPDAFGSGDLLEMEFAQPVTAGAPSAADSRAAIDGEWTEPSTADVSAKDDPSATSPRYLSTRIFEKCLNDDTGDCTGGYHVRSSYLRFQSLPGTVGPFGSRVVSSRQVFDDDTGCGNTKCFVQTDSSDWNGVGQSRDSVTSSNFPNAESRSTETAYAEWSADDRLDTLLPWLHTTYDSQKVTEGSSTQETRFCFAAATGALERRRVLAGSVPQPTDLLSVFTVSPRGETTAEEYYGGDTGDAGDPALADVCSSSLEDLHWSFKLTNKFESKAGLRTKTLYHDAVTGNALGFNAHDVDFDPTTALVTKSRDVAGVETSYGYDAKGRLVSVAPAGVDATTYTYFPAEYDYDEEIMTSFARVEINAAATSAAASKSTIEFDSVGRIRTESVLLPADPADASANPVWASRITQYNYLGKSKVSELETGMPSHFTVFSGYDAFGRPATVTAPDNASVSFTYKGVREKKRTASVWGGAGAGSDVSVETTEESDAFGRLVGVTEDSATGKTKQLTTYKYDVGDRLTEVCLNKVGATCGQTKRTFTYDARGFLSSEAHPESGTSSYTYDALGHMRTRLAGGRTMQYTYDGAERLTAALDVDANRLLEKYEFGTANSGSDMRQGKLWKASRYNWFDETRVSVTETYAYTSASGQASSRTTQITRGNDQSPVTIQTLTTNFAYDAQGLPSGVTLPVCTASICTVAGALSSIGSQRTQGKLVKTTSLSPGSSTATSVAALTYHPSGMLAQVAHGATGSLTDIYAAADGLPRPSKISFTGALTCIPPEAPTFTASPVSPVMPGATVEFTVAQQTDATFAWVLPNGGTASGLHVSFPAPAATFTVTVTAQKCGSTATSQRTVTVCPAMSDPVITAPSSVMVGASGSATVSIAGNETYAYLWTISDGTLLSSNTAQTVTFSASAAGTITLTVQVTASGSCAGSKTATRTVTAVPPAPASVQATTVTNTAVHITWNAVPGAQGYVVERATLRGGNATVVSPVVTDLQFNDTAPATSLPVTYVYYVRSVGLGGFPSGRGGHDYATTAAALFARNIAASVAILAADIVELRRCVDAVRVSAGLLAVFNGGPSPGDVIAATDFRTLMSALSAAKAVYSQPDFSYVPALAAGEFIYAAHVLQLREALR